MKIFPIDLLASITAELRSNGRTVVLAHGVFDVVTVGHARHLQAAKKLGDVLVVTVTPDRLVGKGPDRPIFSQTLRAEHLAAMSCVDYVAINQWPTAVETIETLKPHIYVKGGKEYDGRMTHALANEEDAVLCLGGKLVFTNEDEFHTTDLMKKVLAHG